MPATTMSWLLLTETTQTLEQYHDSEKQQHVWFIISCWNWDRWRKIQGHALKKNYSQQTVQNYSACQLLSIRHGGCCPSNKKEITNRTSYCLTQVSSWDACIGRGLWNTPAAAIEDYVNPVLHVPASLSWTRTDARKEDTTTLIFPILSILAKVKSSASSFIIDELNQECDHGAIYAARIIWPFVLLGQL